MANKENKGYAPEFLKKLFPYSRGEDIANSVSHIVGAGISIIMLMYLMYVAGKYGGSYVEGITFGIFGISMIAMFTMSAIYHMIKNETARNVMKRMDHNMIFVLILGTYTPYVFVAIKSPQIYMLYAVLIIIGILGIIVKSIWIGKFKRLATLLYVLMGWASVMMGPELINSVSMPALYWLLIGGIMYTVCAVIYAFAKFKYHHLVWHIFVMFGAFSHFISIAFYLLPR